MAASQRLLYWEHLGMLDLAGFERTGRPSAPGTNSTASAPSTGAVDRRHAC
jgi:hypothetical protein